MKLLISNRNFFLNFHNLNKVLKHFLKVQTFSNQAITNLNNYEFFTFPYFSDISYKSIFILRKKTFIFTPLIWFRLFSPY